MTKINVGTSIQWRTLMVGIVTGCALFVTSHCDIKFTFSSNVLAKFVDTVHIRAANLGRSQSAGAEHFAWSRSGNSV